MILRGPWPYSEKYTGVRDPLSLCTNGPSMISALYDLIFVEANLSSLLRQLDVNNTHLPPVTFINTVLRLRRALTLIRCLSNNMREYEGRI